MITALRKHLAYNTLVAHGHEARLYDQRHTFATRLINKALRCFAYLAGFKPLLNSSSAFGSSEMIPSTPSSTSFFQTSGVFAVQGTTLTPTACSPATSSAVSHS